jgi:hypothetical protein
MKSICVDRNGGSEVLSQKNLGTVGTHPPGRVAVKMHAAEVDFMDIGQGEIVLADEGSAFPDPQSAHSI